MSSFHDASKINASATQDSVDNETKNSGYDGQWIKNIALKNNSKNIYNITWIY